MSKIRLVDTTLRDGHQCLWATRMTTDMILPAAERMDEIGFRAIELMGAVHFDACVRYLHEDPWERMREVKKRFRKTPLQGIIRSGCILGFEPKPADLNRLWVDTLIANGVDRLIAFDGLHDFDNMVPNLRRAKELGATTIAWLIFSDSPVHTDQLYVDKAKEIIARADVDEILIQDTSGILTPERAATLVPALKAVVGDRPLGLHSHSLVGLPQRTYLEAVRHGVDDLYTCIPPIADGNAPPSVVQTIRNLRHYGYEVDVDDGTLAEVGDYLDGVTTLSGRPRGQVRDFDGQQFDHQIPGGVLSNLVAQLEQLGIGHRIDEVLEECGRVRAELGWPIQVTPFSQFVAVQATYNLLEGERYSKVPDEVKKYALGYFGKLLAPVQADVLDRIVERGSKSIPLEPPEPAPVVDGLRKQYPDLSDEQRLLRHSFPEKLVNDIGQPTPPGEGLSSVTTPLASLVKGLTIDRRMDYVFVRQGPVEFELDRQGRGGSS